MVNLYLDANIYIDYWEDRKDNLRPLGEFAHIILRRAISCEFVICYSDLVLSEVCKGCNMSKDEVFEHIFSPLEKAGKLRHITYNYEPEATNISKENNIHKADAVHIALAEKCNAILVSRDNEVLALRKRLNVAKPEEL
jgi:predicted nucleic acid-binding protein